MNLLSLGTDITKLPAIIRFGEIEEKVSEDETYRVRVMVRVRL